MRIVSYDQKEFHLEKGGAGGGRLLKKRLERLPELWRSATTVILPRDPAILRTSSR
jgi:hypothetical protein